MRADNDHAVGNSVESCKDESKPHEKKWEDAEVKVSENGKSNNNVCELFYDTRSSDEWDKENDGNALESHSRESGKKSRDVAANGDSVEKVDPVFYMDKNVTACDLPEIVVCYKENSYHVVKDICVDEGVPVQEKFLFGEKDSVKCSSNSEDLLKAEKVNVNPLETKSSEDRNGKVDDSVLCNDPKKANREVEESSREDSADAQGASNCNQEDLIVVTEKIKDLHPSEIESDENSKDAEVATLENVLKECLTLGDILLREDEQKSLNQNNNSDKPEEQSPPLQLQDEEKGSLETIALKTEQPDKTEHPVKTEHQEKAEDKLSSVSTTTSQEPNQTCNDPETKNQQQNSLSEGDKHFGSSFGETSFSAAEAVSISGHISYSGPITFSGSLSVRSDASTTSGRSFAFPILQSEWNSSPVRMAKADKRRQKGWRHSFLCCRFS